MTQFTKGMRERIGVDAVPSWALYDRHVRYFDNYFEAGFGQSRTTTDKRHWARAGLANLLLWLGWLRSSELFELRWMDIECVRPDRGPTKDLPVGVGCLLLRLKEATKTNRDSTADLPIAYTTVSGYRPGKWYERLVDCHNGQEPTNDPSYIFISDQGVRWDSFTFRHAFVYPLLTKLMMEGDPYLTPLGRGGDGNTIEAKFKSLHMYRRGGRSHCEIVREKKTGRKKATQPEIYEHGRWRQRRESEPIDVMYRQWSLYDRLQITLWCM